MFFIVVFKHREVNHPQSLPTFFVQTVGLTEVAVADLQAQSTQRIVNNLGAIGTEEDYVTVLSAGHFKDVGEQLIGEVLHDRALQAFTTFFFFIDLDVGQPLGTVNLDKFGVGVDFRAGHARSVRHIHGDHFAVRQFSSRTENLEFRGLGLFGDFAKFNTLNTKIGLIGTEAGHGFVPAHHRIGIGQINVDGFFEDIANHVFHDVADFLLGEERGFDINLGKFGLTVGAEVFVTEAFNDLVVAVKTGNHQQLFKQLRRLRQGIKMTVMHTARNQVVAGTFRGAAREHRGFNIDKALLIQVIADGQCNLVAQFQIALHLQAAQVQNAVRQTSRFRKVFVIEVERRRFRLIEDGQFPAEHFNAARDQVGVAGAFGTGADKAHHLQAVFIADGVSRLEDFRIVRVTDDLQQTFAVAQVDEDDSAVVTATVGPTVKGHRLTDEFFIDKTGIFGTHKCSQSMKGMISQEFNRTILI